MLAIVVLAICSQICLVAGQIFLKQAMNATNATPVVKGKVVRRFSLAVGMLSGWFFLWVGLLQKKDLSYLFPFEGLSFVLLLLAARFILREKLSARAWVGMGFVAVGMMLVAKS